MRRGYQALDTLAVKYPTLMRPRLVALLPGLLPYLRGANSCVLLQIVGAERRPECNSSRAGTGRRTGKDFDH